MLDQIQAKVKLSAPRVFNSDENETWAQVVRIQRPRRAKQMYYLFEDGLKTLAMDQDSIPDLQIVNRKLKNLTGWEGVLVEGLEGGETFYQLLAERRFPIGNFVRDKKDLNYTPEPDIIHDFYGHIPFYADRTYADFCQKYGEVAMKYVSEPEKFRQFERVFWFTVEFGLIETTNGVRVFGAGIASSIGECEYALSEKPEVLPFDLNVVRKQEFRIDEMQKRLFCLRNTEQLYSCLGDLENAVRKE